MIISPVPKAEPIAADPWLLSEPSWAFFDISPPAWAAADPIFTALSFVKVAAFWTKLDPKLSAEPKPFESEARGSSWLDGGALNNIHVCRWSYFD